MTEMQVTPVCHSALLLMHGMQFCSPWRLQLGATHRLAGAHGRLQPRPQEPDPQHRG